MGVLCKFFIWVIDVVCMVLLSGQPLTVMCAGLSSLLVLIVVFLVVCDRSNIHHARSCRRIIGVSFSRSGPLTRSACACPVFYDSTISCIARPAQRAAARRSPPLVSASPAEPWSIVPLVPIPLRVIVICIVHHGAGRHDVLCVPEERACSQ